MNKILLSFIITTFAGISTIMGYFVIFVKKNNHNKVIVSALSFAAGVMVCTSISDLIPESINLLSTSLSTINTIIFSFLSVLLGIITSMIINYYVPDNNNYKDNNLFRIGIISMIAIILHNIPEGIATFMASSNYINLVLSFSVAIAMHNTPEAISIAIPIYYSTGKKRLAFIYTFISALSELIGAIICYLFLRKYMTNFLLGITLSIIAGIMLEISFRTLLPSTKKYNYKSRVIFFFIIGVMFMLFRFII